MGAGGSGRLRETLTGGAVVAALLAPGAADASPHGFLAATDSLSLQPTLAIRKGERTEILDRVVLTGRVAFPGRGRAVKVRISREGRQVSVRRLKADPLNGRYRTSLRLRGCCEYVVQAFHASGTSDAVRFDVSAPRGLEAPQQALLFNRLLRSNGYHMGEVTDEVGESTSLAIMALRKAHGLPRTEEYSPELFRMLLSGGARFRPEHREPGRHVEVDVSRQVMALVEDGVATDVFHVSTGAGGTPTGEWSFYSKTPGYNAKGMYYSVFYDGNYATHGYSSVPAYPASHGCTRNPLPYAVFIYDWISLGDEIYVYA